MKGYWSLTHKLIVSAITLALALGLLNYLLQPCLFVESEGKLLAWFIIAEDTEAFSLRFIHSVEKTPVIEKYRVDKQHNLVMFTTEYESFGVGLPFLASDGRFYPKGGRFVMEMNRVFPSVALRTGPEAKLTLTVNNRQLQLYQMLPAGSMVQLSAGTWLSRVTDYFAP